LESRNRIFESFDLEIIKFLSYGSDSNVNRKELIKKEEYAA
jgi:hypothetical protein